MILYVLGAGCLNQFWGSHWTGWLKLVIEERGET